MPAFKQKSQLMLITKIPKLFIEFSNLSSSGRLFQSFGPLSNTKSPIAIGLFRSRLIQEVLGGRS